MYQYTWSNFSICKNRIVDKKYNKICFYPQCLNIVINDNYCYNHQNEKSDF